jgi:hypothetical protein
MEIDYKGYKIYEILDKNKSIVYEFIIGNDDCFEGSITSKNIKDIQEYIDEYILQLQKEYIFNGHTAHKRIYLSDDLKKYQDIPVTFDKYRTIHKVRRINHITSTMIGSVMFEFLDEKDITYFIGNVSRIYEKMDTTIEDLIQLEELYEKEHELKVRLRYYKI